MKPLFSAAAAPLAAAIFTACNAPNISPTPSSLATTSTRPENRANRATLNYTFETLAYPGLSNFNELLGINNEGRITGFYGSGSPSDPSSGYVIYPPYQAKNFRLLQYPQAAGTIATAINNKRTEAGYYINRGGHVISFVYLDGLWWTYEDPRARGAAGKTEILSLNDAGVAVGIYRANSGSGAFELNIANGHFTGFNPAQGTNAVATGINGSGDIVGYWTQSGTTVGFLRKDGSYTTFSYPGAQSTEFLGVTAHDYIVGSYVDKYGSTHGLLLISPLWKRGTQWQSIDDPKASGMTVATSVNIHKVVVGYYVDGSGRTDGFLATPSSSK